jgi:hypothetical protein
LKSTHGGKRPGAGKPKGVKWASTIEKEAARELVRQRITERLAPLVDAQIDSAIGISHFMLRDKLTGQWMRLTDPDQIVAALNDPKAKQGSTFLVYTKDPNSNAAKDMLDRAIDRPKEQPMEMKVDASDALIERLKDGMRRASKGGK